MKTAIYAFSGDPVTNGHLNIIKRARKVFDEVIVAIGVNPEKKYLFNFNERLELAREAVKNMAGVRSLGFEGLLTDFALEAGISVVVRGVRNAADFEYEKTLFQVGRQQADNLEFVYLMADPAVAHISSGAVKAIQREHGRLLSMVPMHVKAALELKVSGQTLIGVTGEMGAGKSWLCERLCERATLLQHPCHHLDLDVLAHEILGADESEYFVKFRRNISREFNIPCHGTSCFLNRKRLASEVFTDKEGVKSLSSMFAQPIRLKLRKALRGKRGIILVDSALMAEVGLIGMCNNRVILVSSARDVQARRLRGRKVDPHVYEKRWKLQMIGAKKKEVIIDEIARVGFGKLWQLENSSRVDDVDSLLNKLMRIGDFQGKINEPHVA